MADERWLVTDQVVGVMSERWKVVRESLDVETDRMRNEVWDQGMKLGGGLAYLTCRTKSSTTSTMTALLKSESSMECLTLVNVGRLERP